jgi:DNA-binding MarR family transcriptional regulator
MREARRSVERWGLTLAQFDVLAELERSTRGGFTFGELSRLLLVTSGNLTGIVDRLESDGLARRKTSRDDRRVVRIVLTAKGRQLVQAIAREHARDIRAALGPMPRDRQSMLEHLLHVMGDGLRNRAGETRTPHESRGGSAPPRRDR